MKNILLSAAALLMLGGFLPASVVFAADGSLLYEKLTCHTCHGPQGKGMIRTETKEKYYLRKKEMYRKMIKEGIPVDIVKQLIPLYRKKFRDKDKFIKAVEEFIGQVNTRKYKEIIIGIAGRVYYRKGDIIPGFEDYPMHAGNKKIYLFRQMKDILDGKRTNGNSAAMRGIKPFLDKNKVTDADLESIAEYLSNAK
ncbi:MAG: c-type cytochrome [Deltaproteobacteria bacterium]|nr:c-type cytochrome [Deltaproteobacteria bacterium]